MSGKGYSPPRLRLQGTLGNPSARSLPVFRKHKNQLGHSQDTPEQHLVMAHRT